MALAVARRVLTSFPPPPRRKDLVGSPQHGPPLSNAAGGLGCGACDGAAIGRGLGGYWSRGRQGTIRMQGEGVQVEPWAAAAIYAGE
ncbi:hypothetical protein VTN96DRAFT_8259 [Rasamsonia emersonii]